MRELVPSIPALVLPPVGASSSPGTSLAALVADLGTTFDSLESFIDADAADGPDMVGFRRLDALVTAAVQRIADTPAPDLDGLRVKARLLLNSPPVREDDERSSAIGASLGLDVLRLLGTGGRHGS